MAAKLLSLGLLLGGSAAWAQDNSPPLSLYNTGKPAASAPFAPVKDSSSLTLPAAPTPVLEVPPSPYAPVMSPSGNTTWTAAPDWKKAATPTQDQAPSLGTATGAKRAEAASSNQPAPKSATAASGDLALPPMRPYGSPTGISTGPVYRGPMLSSAGDKPGRPWAAYDTSVPAPRPMRSQLMSKPEVPHAQTLVFDKEPNDLHELQGVLFQPPVRPDNSATLGEGSPAYQILLETPGPGRLFRLDSEPALQERIRQEHLAREPRERTSFPEYAKLTDQTYLGRQWPEMHSVVEPNYVGYGRLYFEEKNSERFGWDFGIAQPLISTGAFFTDLALMPYHFATDPLRCHEYNTGYCLPGDPVPYCLYPPGLSITGATGEAAAVLGLLAIFP